MNKQRWTESVNFPVNCFIITKSIPVIRADSGIEKRHVDSFQLSGKREFNGKGGILLKMIR